MPQSIYCNAEIADSDLSLEHVIPLFLGGAYAPDRFKLPLACRRCNNNLGLFVDAAFEKDWTVGNNLAIEVVATRHAGRRGLRIMARPPW